jgi:hypothetical protein
MTASTAELLQTLSTNRCSAPDTHRGRQTGTCAHRQTGTGTHRGTETQAHTYTHVHAFCRQAPPVHSPGPTPYLAVGLSCELGEDYPCLGRIALYSLDKDAPGPVPEARSWRGRPIASRDTVGPVNMLQASASCSSSRGQATAAVAVLQAVCE